MISFLTKQNTRKMTVTIMAICSSYQVYAKEFYKVCPTLDKCLQNIGELKKEEYLYHSDLKAKIQSTSTLEVNKENADLLLTTFLKENSLARIPLTKGGDNKLQKTYVIVESKNVRYHPLPLLNASFQKAPQFANSWDWYQMNYRPQNQEVLELLTRQIRRHLSRFGRVAKNSMDGTIQVFDTTNHLNSIYQLLKSSDKNFSVTTLKKLKENSSSQQKSSNPKKHAPSNQS